MARFKMYEYKRIIRKVGKAWMLTTVNYETCKRQCCAVGNCRKHIIKCHKRQYGQLYNPNLYAMKHVKMNFFAVFSITEHFTIDTCLKVILYTVWDEWKPQ